MKDAHARTRESKRHSGDCPSQSDKVPTYQELLDEALDETFPASDPISPTAAMHASHRIESARDEVDWALRPGGHQPPPLNCEGQGGLLTQALAQEALDRLKPMLEAAIGDPDVCATGALAVVVLNPVCAHLDQGFDESILLEHGFGDRDAWDADHAGSAREKARLSWESGEDSRIAQARPHLLRAGDTLVGGGVNLDGLVVGVSGAHPWYDEAFAMSLAAMLRSLSLREHARLTQSGASQVAAASSASSPART